MKKPPRLITPAWRKRIAWTVVAAIVLYWPLAFAATHLPPRSLPSSGLRLDKVLHFGSYALLAALLTGGLALWNGWRWKWAVLAMVIAALYGVIDELTQPFVGRTADVKDWVADLLGASLGALFAGVACEWVHWRRRRRSDSDA